MKILYRMTRPVCWFESPLFSLEERAALTAFAKALQDSGRLPERLDGLTLVAEGITDDNIKYAEYK